MKETRIRPVLLGVAASALCALVWGQTAPGPPSSGGGTFPLSEVHRGLHATAWTVFTGDKPEPMDVEILGVLRGGRGPGHDMILAQLHGAKPEYTGVVAGMSGSPVYIGNKLLGSLSYRIGMFSKDPIAGITPIEQMLEVRDLPPAMPGSQPLREAAATSQAGLSPSTTFQPMETPLVMSGFSPEAIKLWQEKMAGTGLDVIAAGGGSGSSASSTRISQSAIASIVPGSAVSAELVRGDLEIAATCTVTYVDPKQLLACGHPILQAGPVSIPMTTAEVLATLASPLNAFKIINTGEPIGAFTDDRDSAIRGVLGEQARMIPIHITVHDTEHTRRLNIEVLDLPALTPQAVLVSVYQSLVQTNLNTAETSYHITGNIDMQGYPAAPLDLWAPAGDGMPAPLVAALQVGERFSRFYSNDTRIGAMRSITLEIESVPHRVSVDLQSARVVSSNIVHPGETIAVEATVRPWQQPERNIRIPVHLPARLQPGNLRLLVSDGATLDRTLEQPRPIPRPTNLENVLAQARSQHAQDRVYVSILVPETQAGMNGRALTSLPLSLANAFETLRTSQEATLNGESAEVAAEAPAGGVLSGFQVLSLRVETGSPGPDASGVN